MVLDALDWITRKILDMLDVPFPAKTKPYRFRVSGKGESDSLFSIHQENRKTKYSQSGEEAVLF